MQKQVRDGGDLKYQILAMSLLDIRGCGRAGTSRRRLIYGSYLGEFHVSSHASQPPGCVAEPDWLRDLT